MTPGFSWITLCSVVVLGGCGLFVAKETAYLRSAEGRATQEEVTQQLGPPVMTKVRVSGESLWVYQIRTQQAGSRISAPGTWCDEYVLTFDSQAILRDWTHQSYFHGGENNPTYCVPGGMDGKDP